MKFLGFTLVHPVAIEPPYRPMPATDKDREARLVRDMADHAAAQVMPTIDRLGRTMETAQQANVMAIEVAIRIGLEAARRCGLAAAVEGASLDEAIAKVDVAIVTVATALADQRAALIAAVEAAHAGVAGGRVRP